MGKRDLRNGFFGVVLASFLVVIVGAAGVASAQTDAPSLVADDAEDVDVPEVGDFSDEGLGDDDLTVDLEAEALPTTDPWAYRWERWQDTVISVFTFNSERKAQQLRTRLHQLDRKLEACAKIGDPECAEKIEARIERMQERTEKYIAKRDELKEQFQDRFEAWREKRQLRQDTLELELNEHKEKRQELINERKMKREEAKQNRIEYIETRKSLNEDQREERKLLKQDRVDVRRENLQERQDQREQNREQLIEVRSSNLKSRLDDTRLKVDGREAELLEAVDAVAE